MNEKLRIKKTIKEDKMLVEFEGSIDEDAYFEDIPFDPKTEYLFDFNNLTRINSCGIREWISFLKKFDGNAKLTYQRCPRILVDQINRAQGLLRKGVRIKSFYAPYYCKEKDIEKTILLQDSDLKDGNPPSIKNDYGDEMYFDASMDQYLQFLKRMDSKL